jgi:hypothetical protein
MLVPHDEEQTILAEIRQMRTAGLTQQAIAMELNRRGRRTRTGGVFQRYFVAQLHQRHVMKIA